jgi:hypothetical protein
MSVMSPLMTAAEFLARPQPLDGSKEELGEGDTLDGYDVLPGFTLPVAELFG